jgi:MFS family permease
MCVGAIVFLMLGRILGMKLAFVTAAATVLAIGGAFALWLREPRTSVAAGSPEAVESLASAAWSIASGALPGLRTIFISTLLLQLTFQTFTTWYALHGIERFGVRAEDVTIGFIAWAIGGVIGALPAGLIGVRLGRRNTMLLGLAVMAVSLVALDRVDGIREATPLIALAAAAWTFPMVNAYPLFVEQIPRPRRGVIAALFVLCMAGGAIGDPLNGALFDFFGQYRSMFLLMAVYTALAFVAVLFVPAGVGEAGSAPEPMLG